MTRVQVGIVKRCVCLHGRLVLRENELRMNYPQIAVNGTDGKRLVLNKIFNRRRKDEQV